MFPELNPHVHLHHIQAEHNRLETCVCQLKQTFSTFNPGAPDQSADEILTQFSALYDELNRHFREEEQGGCLEEAVSRCPRLADKVKQIEAEHDNILNQLMRIMVRVADKPLTTAKVKAIESAMDELCEAIRRHEVSENRIMTAAFGVAA